MAEYVEPRGRVERPATPTGDTWPLGAREPLGVADLPTPEEVFDTPRIGFKQAVTLVIGPSLVALGLSIGSGEWLLAPLAIGTEGWVGVGFVALLSILLQALYNMEIGRYVLATGEVPSMGFGRIPPGAYVGTILAVLLFYLAFITGGWAAGAGDGLFTLLTGDVPAEGDRTESRLLAVLLIAVVFAITLVGRKISRTLELVNWVLVVGILILMLIIDILVVGWSDLGDGLEGLFRPALPPAGTDAADIGAVAGFAAMASGLNYVFMNYYRDKGYGMGSRTGFIPALLGGEKREVAAVGTTFRETPENAALWKRWWGFLKAEMWLVFVPGALLGILLPGILISHLAQETGTAPSRETMPTYAAEQLRATGEGDFFFYLALVIGFLVLFTTQIVVFEMLVRNFVDAVYGSSDRFRQALGGDPRKFYYPFMILLAIVISIIIFQALPTSLVSWAANMSNLAALVMPLLLMYLISRLPRPAKAQWWSYLILIVVMVYFGYFFLNFLVGELSGGDTDLSFW
ncbi:MAG TPA: Nramp family divalent metal transporter [Gaiellaceae bacterium]|nr:Nramp family divalent metal transporter [Gaiellaceae bacterium]